MGGNKNIRVTMLQPANDTKHILQNKSATIEVDLFGGAITDFHLQDHPVNPLTFHFTKKQMPANNKAGAPYRGHFACIGRWGEPTTGEIKAGLPNHGQPANILWQIKRRLSKSTLQTEVTSPMEGLHIRRNITMDKHLPLYQVQETITNIHTLGRWYHVVQHPTIAAPFLDNSTVINCNASKGFEYRNAGNYSNHLVTFPNVKDDRDNVFKLTNPQKAFNSVFSFVVKKDEPYGWITAYSPAHALLFGYVWPREHYPWISLWQHFDNNIIKYRGLEFGTTGLHQPFRAIIENNQLEVLGERTATFIDAGASQTRAHASFLCTVSKKFSGVKKIDITNNTILIRPVKSTQQIEAGKINFNNNYGI